MERMSKLMEALYAMSLSAMKLLKLMSLSGGNLYAHFMRDIALFENCLVKQLGSYAVINASSWHMTLRPNHPDVLHLHRLRTDVKASETRSPQKINPVSMSKLASLTETNVKQLKGQWWG